MLSFRIIEFKYLIQPFADEIHLGSVDERHRLQRNKQQSAVMLKHQVIAGRLFGSIQNVAKASAARLFHRELKTFDFGILGHQGFHLFRRSISQDHALPNVVV